MTFHARAAEGERFLTLRRAILVYESDEGAAFATVHSIEVGDGGRPTIQPGRPIDRAAVGQMVEQLSGGGYVRELLPSTVLYADPTLLVWWAPAAGRPIFFRTGRTSFDAAMDGQGVSHPPLLFVATPGRLRVHALRESRRPEGDDPLFVAPYFNLFSGGAMCAGNVRLPETLRPQGIDAWERAFFDTRFTHSNHSGKLTSFAGGHDALWRWLAEDADRPFPVESLVAQTTPSTVAQVLRGEGAPR